MVKLIKDVKQLILAFGASRSLERLGQDMCNFIMDENGTIKNHNSTEWEQFEITSHERDVIQNYFNGDNFWGFNEIVMFNITQAYSSAHMIKNGYIKNVTAYYEQSLKRFARACVKTFVALL